MRRIVPFIVAVLLLFAIPAAIRAQAQPTPSPTPPPPCPGLPNQCPAPVGYPAGWNLVAGPEGTVLHSLDAPLYTLDSGASTYTVLSESTPLRAGKGYWAHFYQPTGLFIRQSGDEYNTVTVGLPAGQFVMIGNPFGLDADVLGTDVVYTYSNTAVSPISPYQETTYLRPGWGAWAYSASGGTATITDEAHLPHPRLASWARETTCPSPAPCTATLGAGQSLVFPTFTVLLDSPYNSVTIAFDGRALTIGPGLAISVDAPDAARCRQVNGLASTIRCESPQGLIRIRFEPPNPGTGSCPTTTLGAGWNLLSGAIVSWITTNVGPIYGYDAERGSYFAVAEASDLPGTSGYWVLFDQTTEVQIACAVPAQLSPESRAAISPPVMLEVGAGWTLIGNGLRVGGPARVCGADAVVVYTPGLGYGQSNVVRSGQGAWVCSAEGGVLMLTPVERGC